MDQKIVNIIIVSRIGPMQDTLSIVFSGVPWLEVVGLADNYQEAVACIQAQRPTLIVIDSNLPQKQTKDLITYTKSLDNGIRCLVFYQTALQNTQALESGADLVLPRDEASAELEKSLWELAFSTANPPDTENAQPITNSERAGTT